MKDCQAELAEALMSFCTYAKQPFDKLRVTNTQLF